MSISNDLPPAKQLLTYGQEWEDTVIELVRSAGWQAEFYGQRTSAPLQEILRGTKSLSRYCPDIIARTPDNQILFIECKRSYPNRTGNHAIQVDNLHAQIQWVNSYPTDGMVFAFPNEGQTWPCWMNVTTAAANAKRANYRGRGSGTPFYIISHYKCHVGDMTVALDVGSPWKK